MGKVFLEGHQLAQFQQELDDVRAQVMQNLGEADAAYIKRVRGLVQGSAIAGRGLLMFGIGPISWVAGIAALAQAKILENMELGHNVLHDRTAFTDDPVRPRLLYRARYLDRVAAAPAGP